MKPRFDPDKAVEVEDDILDRFMEQMNARSQSKQLQQVADSLRVLLEMTRSDSDKLLAKYKDEFDELVKRRDELLETMLDDALKESLDKTETKVGAIEASITKSVSGSFDRIMNRTDTLSTAVGRVEKLVKDMASAPKGVEPDNASIRTLLSEVAALRAQMDAPREDKVSILIDMVKSMKEAVPQKKSWAFAIERDDFSRIKNVTATSA
jgi:DNA anti-recombination protein RmuC